MSSSIFDRRKTLKGNDMQKRFQKGFTAVELTMVATIIAILALLIIPILRNKAELAKKTACIDEMNSFAKIQTIAHAETGYFFRLQDLDNTKEMRDPSTEKPPYEKELPFFAWNGEPLNRVALYSKWEGPYVEYNDSVDTKVILSKTLANLASFSPSLDYFYTTYSPTVSTNNVAGGIFGYQHQAGGNYQNDEIPLDPWGNPYFFYGPGNYDETSYTSCAVMSLGPDGKCGDKNTAAASATRIRRINFGKGANGTNDSDDIIFEF